MAARVQSASNAIFGRHQGLVDALATAPGVAPSLRAAAIRGLRQQQAAEAGIAYKRIMGDAFSAARMRSKLQKDINATSQRSARWSPGARACAARERRARRTLAARQAQAVALLFLVSHLLARGSVTPCLRRGRLQAKTRLRGLGSLSGANG
ncbi:MAG: hypothetical protein M1423_05425 [Acidobacteria bacterium]|nr:hypothetical protein [Acidobacteriota bacterium]